jgi:hypothetical protein
MFCPNCENNIEDRTKFCPYCGTTIKNDNINDTILFTNTPIPAQQMQPSMKWYKFIIYFQLFAGALTGIASLGSVIEDKLNYEEKKKEMLELTDFENFYYDEMLDMFGKMDTFFKYMCYFSSLQRFDGCNGDSGKTKTGAL